MLAGSAHPADYTARLEVGALSTGKVNPENDAALMLITARDAVDVDITGGGTIDGAGRHFIDEDLGTIPAAQTSGPSRCS